MAGEKKSKAVLVRLDPSLFAQVERVAAQRQRDRGELLRLYAARCLAADIARLERGERLDDLGGADPPPTTKPRSGHHQRFGTPPRK